jgi:hypothetical protein
MKKVRTPQRLVAVTKYLTEVMQDEKASTRLRMTAAERLCELFLEGERGKRERQIAIARADSRAQQAAGEKTGIGTIETLTEATQSPNGGVVEPTEARAQMDAYLLRTIGK